MANVAGVYTDRGEAKLAGFVADFGDLIEGSIRAKQGVVDVFGDVLGNRFAATAVRDAVGTQTDEAASEVRIELGAALAEAAGFGAGVPRVAAAGGCAQELRNAI